MIATALKVTKPRTPRVKKDFAVAAEAAPPLPVDGKAEELPAPAVKVVKPRAPRVKKTAAAAPAPAVPVNVNNLQPGPAPAEGVPAIPAAVAAVPAKPKRVYKKKPIDRA